MSVTESYLAYVLEQLEYMGAITARKMFGGAGIYKDNIFFALIADDVLYFKANDTNRAEYETRGMEPFRPYGDDSFVMSYYEVPEEILEDRDELHKWAGKAIQVATLSKVKNIKRKRKRL